MRARRSGGEGERPRFLELMLKAVCPVQNTKPTKLYNLHGTSQNALGQSLTVFLHLVTVCVLRCPAYKHSISTNIIQYAVTVQNYRRFPTSFARLRAATGSLLAGESPVKQTAHTLGNIQGLLLARASFTYTFINP